MYSLGVAYTSLSLARSSDARAAMRRTHADRLLPHEIRTNSPHSRLNDQLSVSAVLTSEDRKVLSGPPWLTTVILCPWLVCSNSCATDLTRASNTRSLSPDGGARFHGSAAQGSLCDRGISFHRRPSQAPK